MTKIKSGKIVELSENNFSASTLLTSTARLSLYMLEHPLFSLKRNGKDMSTFEYKSNNGEYTIKVSPSTKGRMTIKDTDFIAYLQSKVVKLIDSGFITEKNPEPEITIDTIDFLQFCHRSIGGKSYSLIEDMLDRVSGTSISVTAPIDKDLDGIMKKTYIDPEYKVVRRASDSSVIQFTVKCRSWFVIPLIMNKSILSIPEEYFDISKPLERRMWQIARMHCTEGKIFKINWEFFFNKIGTAIPFTQFRAKVRSQFKASDNKLCINEYVFSEDSTKKNVLIQILS